MRSTLLAALLVASAASALSAQAPADTSALPPQEIGTIAPGQTRGGLLEAGDWNMSDGTWADVWYVQLAAGQRITIECRSRGFTAFVQFLDPWGGKLAENAGGGSGVRLNGAAREAGRYQVVVNNYSETPQAGTYVITIR